MPKLAENVHGTGAVFDRIDTRDYLFKEIGFATPAFDWTVGFDIEAKLGIKLPVKDQGRSGSCGGQAWANLAGVLESVNTGNLEERSAKFIYAQTYAPGGGSYGRDNANIFINQGVSRETVLTSYQNGNPPTEAFMERGQDVTPLARMDATLDMSSSYAQVDLKINEVARALRDTNGVVIMIDGQDNGTWLSAFPKPPTNTSWRHFLYVGKAKMIDGKKYIGVLNSWGITVGEFGWQWLGENYFTSGHVQQAYTHIYNLTPIPPSFHYNFVSNLSFGQSSVDITALQTALQVDGGFPKSIAPTGYYGDVTASAVLAFRLKYGISSSTDTLGRSVGPLTRARLNNLFN